jgi:hypothetical protein
LAALKIQLGALALFNLRLLLCVYFETDKSECMVATIVIIQSNVTEPEIHRAKNSWTTTIEKF